MTKLEQGARGPQGEIHHRHPQQGGGQPVRDTQGGDHAQCQRLQVNPMFDSNPCPVKSKSLQLQDVSIVDICPLKVLVLR